MRNNFVAKHSRQFNKAVTHVDRKKAMKRGADKNKSFMKEEMKECPKTLV